MGVLRQLSIRLGSLCSAHNNMLARISTRQLEMIHGPSATGGETPGLAIASETISHWHRFLPLLAKTAVLFRSTGSTLMIEHQA